MRNKRNHRRPLLPLAALLAVALSPAAFSQTAPSADPKSIPVLDGGAGPCSADFTITDASNAPVYNAKIKVHIAYRFGGFHKLDLEVATNADGKARLTGLPSRVKRTLTFQVSEADRTAEATDDPAQTCNAPFTIVLRKQTQ